MASNPPRAGPFVTRRTAAFVRAVRTCRHSYSGRWLARRDAFSDGGGCATTPPYPRRSVSAAAPMLGRPIDARLDVRDERTPAPPRGCSRPRCRVAVAAMRARRGTLSTAGLRTRRCLPSPPRSAGSLPIAPSECPPATATIAALAVPALSEPTRQAPRRVRSDSRPAVPFACGERHGDARSRSCSLHIRANTATAARAGGRTPTVRPRPSNAHRHGPSAHRRRRRRGRARRRGRMSAAGDVPLCRRSTARTATPWSAARPRCCGRWRGPIALDLTRRIEAPDRRRTGRSAARAATRRPLR